MSETDGNNSNFGLMLEHGIYFQHEGLLIFPSLFDPAPETADGKLPHAVSLVRR